MLHRPLRVKSNTETTITADEFASLFAEAVTDDDGTIQHNIDEPGVLEEADFDLAECTTEDVYKAVNGMPTNKAEGDDGIPMKAIKWGIKPLLKPLTRLINTFMDKGLPLELKRAVILPIHKKGAKDNVANYRPISLLCSTSKITERIISTQINKYLEEKKLMNNAQHGFRQNHSTSTGLLCLTEFIRKELDRGNGIGMVAIDLTKAFDMIDHPTLIKKLQNFGFGSSTISFLRNYLSDRTFKVKVNNKTSDSYKLIKGVPQGSILGPLLFTLYVNDLPNVVKDSRVVLYADDTTLFTSNKYPAKIQEDLNQDIRRLQDWFLENKLKINEDKSEYMTISNSHVRQRFQHIEIKLGNKLLPSKDTIKILGVTISNDLSWETHTHGLINSLRYRFRSFNRSCRMLNTDSRKLLYNAVIASRLNYCDVIWDNCNQTSCNKLQTVQNRCARTILNATPGASSGPLLNELGWLNLKEKRKLHKCVLMHELLLNKGPPALCNELIPFKNRGTYSTRATTNNNGSVHPKSTRESDFVAQ